MLGEKEQTARRRLRLLTVLLDIFVASANGIETEVIPRNPLEGYPVIINIIGITEDIRFSEWYLGNNTSAENQIIRYNNGDGSQNNGTKYFTGTNIYPNGSLEIQKVQKAFEGNYTVFIQGKSNPFQQTVLLGIFVASANGIETEVIPRNPLEGYPVIINIIGITEDIRFSEWYLGNNISAKNQIIRYNNGDGSQNNGTKYFTGTNIYPNGSLEIQKVQKAFEGNYTVFIQGKSNPFQQTVFLSVSMASSNTIQIQLVRGTPEVNQTVLFNVTGITEGIRFSEWYRGNDTSAANQIIRYNNNDGSTNLGQRPIPTAVIFANGSLEIRNATKDLEGDYTVFIQGDRNPFQSTVTLEFENLVTVPTEHRPRLHGGVIAGIVIAAVAVVTGAIAGGVYAFKSKESGPL
ncbi:cell adhesion molecule CEACAM10-like isoform X3 [Aquarana catesbeiana]|uniref:cell adhesion molecule CEACAM10-like isoform X3 n=1 Tax=Aquarana catesbeiana TaxID=8400 RepID=UPI003CC9FC6A